MQGLDDISCSETLNSIQKYQLLGKVFFFHLPILKHIVLVQKIFVALVALRKMRDLSLLLFVHIVRKRVALSLQTLKMTSF